MAPVNTKQGTAGRPSRHAENSLPNAAMGKSKVVAPRNPKLVRSLPVEDKQTPSAYLAEMSLSTEERLKQTYEMRIPQIIELLDMSETTHQKFTSMDIEEPLFQPFPSELIFQNFEPFQSYQIPLQLRNNDKVARLVKVVHANTPYFQIISPPDVAHKVAPGMDRTFLIKFSPDEKKDYSHELVCITEREKFLVPIHALGARGILDFPDDVSFGVCPVKHNNSKTLFLRNVGNAQAKFSLLTESPFSAVPDNGLLDIGESMQIDINFQAMQIGDHNSNLVIQYSSGENIYVTLYGAAEDVNVRLDKNTIKLENTFISSASQRTISIVNRSNIIVHYDWKLLPTAVEEEQQKLRFYHELTYKEEDDRDSFLEECISDPTLRDKLSLLTRSYQNRLKLAKGDKMLYNDDIISLDPVEGDIWPNSQAEINIIFKPLEAKTYERTIYCDVTGRESRLPLRIKGDGVGPKVLFSFDTLDVEEIFVNSAHSYEVVLANKGDIDAIFTYLPSDSLFGSQFSFTPCNGLLKAGDYQAIQIHFSSPHLGEFLEDFYWMIEGSPQKIKFSVRGIVIGPTFHFNTAKLRFGTIAYGFTYSQSCFLINTSLISMAFHLRVPSDGTGVKASLVTQNFTDDIDGPVRKHGEEPMEFEILPSSGILPPQTQVEIQIHFTSLTVKKYETVLVVDVEGVGEDVLSLPIAARCVVPTVTIQTPVLDYGRCFIHYPYEKVVELKNDSDLPVKYELLSQIISDESAIRYQSPFSKGIIEPKSILQVPLQIMVYSIGHLATCAYFAVYGSSELPIQLQIACIGEGPVVHVSSDNIDFGQIPVLTDVTRKLRLSNESFIPAKFHCKMVRPNSLFHVEPTEGVIGSEKSVELRVTANVDDCLRFQDKFVLTIVNNANHAIQLTAQGTGTTIVSDPPIVPTVDLGPLFSSRTCRMNFRLMNKGRRVQQIFWITEGFPHFRAKKRTDYNPDDVKYQKMPPPPEPPRPIFKLIPERLSLSPGQKQDMILEGYTDVPQKVRERMICYSIIGNSMGKDKIMKVDVLAEFIKPLVEFSSKKLSFCILKYPENELIKEVKDLVMTNTSKLPLDITLSIEYPFRMLFDDAEVDGKTLELAEASIHLDVGESTTILVQFDPAFEDNSFCKSISSKLRFTYRDHPHTDEIEIQGDVFYPNLTFDTEVVDFGCVLNDTEHIQVVGVTNSSPIDVHFNWSFSFGKIEFEGREEDEGLGQELSDTEVDRVQPELFVRTAPVIGRSDIVVSDDFVERSQSSMAAIQTESNFQQSHKPQLQPQGEQQINLEVDPELGSLPEIEPEENKPQIEPQVSQSAELLEVVLEPQSAPFSGEPAYSNSEVNTTPRREKKAVTIDECFDVLPLFGTIKSGESQQFQFTFYGHAHSFSHVVAKCNVYGGPKYEIKLRGQASLIMYELDMKTIDLGKQLYDQLASAQITLTNLGRVGFEFTCLNTSDTSVPVHDVITVLPSEGYVDAMSAVSLTIKYLPGIPELFEKSFQIRVGHFEPEDIRIFGEGVFPKIKIDLPRDISEPVYCKFVDEAKLYVDRTILEDVEAEEGTVGSRTSTSVKDVDDEVDRLQVREFAKRLLENGEQMVMKTGSTAKNGKRQKPRACLTPYVLDFGHVVIGTVRSHICQLTNSGIVPVSFMAEKRALSGTGFAIELDKIKALPGYPSSEIIDFTVTFDPKSANLSLGPVEALMPIKVSNGPTVSLCLRAYVTTPVIELSSDMVDFDSVICGQCKVITVQLFNPTQVRCEWRADPPQEKKKSLKHVPMHLRKKMKTEKPQPKIFEVMPPCGILYPRQKLNVQVKFMPTEEKSYQQKLCFKLSQSTEKIFLCCKGDGMEPKLEFTENVLTFGPILPHSAGDKRELTVHNPCSFPVEFYSLEFDRQYLEEEKVLRTMKGYDENSTLLLPPRDPGDQLPKELVDAFSSVLKEKSDLTVDENTDTESGMGEKKLDMEKSDGSLEVPIRVKSTEAGEEIDRVSDAVIKEVREKTQAGESEVRVGELEITPVSAAIARHLGIDLSAEGKAARNRRGIAIIVNGAPLSGKTATAVDLAKSYDVPVLSVDKVVTEAAAFGNSSAAMRVQELCIAAGKGNGVGEDPYPHSVEPSMDNINAVASNMASNALSVNTGTRKTSTMAALKGGVHNVSKTASAHPSPPQTPPVQSVPRRKLSLPEHANLSEELYSCVLPENILVEVIAERLQRPDCHSGVVFDGLESLFTSSLTSTANAVLRAINNRKYIFIVTLKFSKEKLRLIEQKRKEDEAQREREASAAERQRLEEMSEDEYENLPEEEKAEVDKKQLELKRERMKKKKEKEEQKERERKEKELIEERRLEEERAAKSKQRRVTTSQFGNRKDHDKGSKDKKPDKSSEKLHALRETTLKPQSAMGDHRKAGAPAADSESQDDDDRRKTSTAKGPRGIRAPSVAGRVPSNVSPDEVKITLEDEKERELNRRFQIFDASFREMSTLFEAWDRTTGSVFVPDIEKSEIDVEQLPVPAPKKGASSQKKQEREKDKERLKDIAESPVSSHSMVPPDPTASGISEEAKQRDGIGVPILTLFTSQPQKSLSDEVFAAKFLPTPETVLEGLGQGVAGPPIPPPAFFTVVPYPVRRQPPLYTEFGQHYVFVSTGPDDPNAAKIEKPKPVEPEPQEKVVEKKEHKRDKRHREKEDRDSLKSRADRLPSGGKKGRQSGFGISVPSSSPPALSPTATEDDQSAIEQNTSSSELVRHRWVVPPGESTLLKIRFTSEDLGQFDQTMNFELVGTRRRYQIFCRGVCCYPTISREPRVVFPNRKKFRKPEEIVHKKFILNNETFEFGPLLAGKNRDRYREGRYPENIEQLCISNTSPMAAEISFCFQNDVNASTFLLEPSHMVLQPGESQLLNLWAYPKTPGFFEDVIVSCIKENPEPTLFKVSAYGVRPELELDKRIIQFDRVLLHRKETRTVYLRNSTLLPVAWKLNGMDNLGDDFAVTSDQGIIEPKTEYALQLHFRAIRATNIKKIIRLEVSDADNVMGLAHAENIQVHAEAYDVALDMSFPKGADGGLDFGTLRVSDEAKQTCSLKNKGRYEIAYNFIFEPSLSISVPLTDLFTVVPAKGTLIPSDRPTQVQVIFKSREEISIKEQPVLRCQIIEPHLGDSGEVIASIPVKMSVRSVYSKFSIFPVCDINFGSVLVNTRKSRTLTIENKGEFDFRYSIVKMMGSQMLARTKQTVGAKKVRSREGSASGRSLQVGQTGQTKPKRSDSVRGVEVPPTGSNTVRFQLGMYTIFPANGVVLPGGTAQISIDMYSETPVYDEEDIAIDISERAPNDHPGGIEYKLIGEACLPCISPISPETIPLIFEEHRIVNDLSLFRYHTSDLQSGSGVFGEQDTKFVFYNVIVGHRAKGRFKILNPTKVPCDILISIRPASNRPSAKWHDVYEVEPQRAIVPPHGHIFASVLFQPPSMQNYTAIFEAVVDGLPSGVSKAKSLIFEIQGEGNLPRISILKPLTVSKRGNPVVLFNKLLLGRMQIEPLTFRNEGTLPCRVNLTHTDPSGSFILWQIDREKGERIEFVSASDGSGPVKTTSFALNTGEIKTLDVEFKPKEAVRLSAEIRLSVIDNPFEDTAIQLLGEGFQEEVTIDNISKAASVNVNEVDEEKTEVPRSNHIDFGDCEIGLAKRLTFTISNHSPSETVRFEWNPQNQISFTPSVGHLLPDCAKDVIVQYQSNEPHRLQAVNIPCRVTKIQLQPGVGKTIDWDDRKKIVKWVDHKIETTAVSDETAAKNILVSNQPQKCRVVETEAEPPHAVIPGTTVELELLVSAVAGHSSYSLSTTYVNFKDTLMFQTRMHSFTVENNGPVEFHLTWEIRSGLPVLPLATAQEESHEPTPTVKATPTSRSKSRAGAKETTPVTPRKRSSQTDSPLSTPISEKDDASRMPSGYRHSAMATASDGRPASVMALTYEAGSVFAETMPPSELPYSIEPDNVTIVPGTEATFTLRFSPFDVNEYYATLLGSIDNLRPGSQGPSIPITGRSLMPWCHFDLEESDYIASRRNPELKGPAGAPPGSKLDPMMKVVEFRGSGIKAKTVREFSIFNPTDTVYNFKWVNEDSIDGFPATTRNFTCSTPFGKISSGKKFNVVFEYTSSSLEVTESFWRFHILEHTISVPFLLVGSASEPAVSFDQSHINFRELLVGHSAQNVVHIINDEERPYHFHFLEASCFTPGNVLALVVDPMEGIVPPKSKIPISIRFSPKEEEEANFNLICRVKQKLTPLKLNVKAEGFTVNANLICEDSLGNKIFLSRSESNIINFNEVEVNEKSVRQIFVENLSKFNVNFSWELTLPAKIKKRKSEGELSETPLLAVTPLSGSVVPGTRKRCQLSFCPPWTGHFSDCLLRLKVQHGPSYTVTVNGTGVQPALEFSFLTHNFGPCFLFRAGMPLQKTTLSISNADRRDISVECQYENTSCLEVISDPKVLAPGASTDVEFIFYPRELKRYSERIPFEINGLSNVYVDIYGEGTEMKVHVLNPSDRKVNVGAVRVGESTERAVKIINNSLTSLAFIVTATPSLPALQQPNVLSIIPNNRIELNPKEICQVKVVFSPRCRIPTFAEEVTLECAGISLPLFVISGSCQGMEIFLESDSVPFGSVTLGSHSMRTLIMHNTGDIGAAFCWNAERFRPDFSITPIKGYLSAGMEVPFTITFNPVDVNQDIRYDDLRCAIEGGKPLKLTLSGSCIPQMAMKEIVHFSAHVRNRDTKHVSLHNKTNQTWHLKPIIDGEFWTGPDSVTVEPQQSKNYEIVYRPLTMTLDNKRHMGSVFFALPDGSGLLYNLSGSAEPPKPVGNIQRDVPCKMPYTEILPVSNWLRKPQRFRVVIEMLKPEKPDPATTLKGLEYIDLPGLCKKKEYKLQFYAHKEGTFSAKIIFKNETSGEYQFYYVQFKATAPGVLANIDLRTPARQSTSHVVTVNNPLATAVNFQVNCNVSDVNIPPLFTIPPQSDGTLTLEYLPMKAGEATGRLSLQSPDLGLYLYDLTLEATPAGAERPVHFIAPLGTNQTQTCRFLNYARTKAEYLCKVDNPDFLVDKSITAASAVSGGSEVGVDVTFEPAKIGESKGTLTVSSVVGGEYAFPLHGHCLAPKPQGPYTIKAGGSITIPFKNVFTQTTAFNFRVDNPAFSVKPGETIRGKKVHSIVVYFEGNQSESKAARMGKLEVSCPRSAGVATNVVWTFYLKGITP